MANTAKVIYNLLKNSKYTVVLCGSKMLIESGYRILRDGDESYDIEQKYGYSAEELLSAAFFSTRQEQFFRFYKQEILSEIDMPPGKNYLDVAKLEEAGLFNSLITRRVYGLLKRAGCKNVVELHGSVYENYCTHCGKKYPVEYMKEAKKIPLCEDCAQVVRPNVCLFGEMVDNQITTKAAEEVQKAEVLIVLGTNLNTYLCQQLTDYYEGDKLVVIHKDEHFADKYADYLWYSRVDHALDQIIEEMEKDNENDKNKIRP